MKRIDSFNTIPTTRQHVDNRFIRVDSELKQDEYHPIYPLVSILISSFEKSSYYCLSLQNLDTLLSVSHSMRSTLLKCNLTAYALSLLNDEHSNWVVIHGIYELFRSDALSRANYKFLRQKIAKWATQCRFPFESLHYLYSHDHPQPNAVTVTSSSHVLHYNSPIHNAMNVAGSIFSGFQFLPSLLEYIKDSARIHLDDFKFFNWNDKKRIFETLRQSGLDFSFAITQMTIKGFDYETLSRFSIIQKSPPTSKPPNSIAGFNREIDSISLSDDPRILNDPLLVSIILHSLVERRDHKLRPIIVQIPIPLLDEIDFGTYILNKKGFEDMYNTIWSDITDILSQLKCCQGPLCVVLYETMYPYKHNVEHMVNNTPICSYIENIKDRKRFMSLLRFIEEERPSEFKKYIQTGFRNLPLSERARCVFKLYKYVLPPDFVFFWTSDIEEYEPIKTYWNNPATTAYLYQLELQKNKSK